MNDHAEKMQDALRARNITSEEGIPASQDAYILNALRDDAEQRCLHLPGHVFSKLPSDDTNMSSEAARAMFTALHANVSTVCNLVASASMGKKSGYAEMLRTDMRARVRAMAVPGFGKPDSREVKLIQAFTYDYENMLPVDFPLAHKEVLTYAKSCLFDPKTAIGIGMMFAAEGGCVCDQTTPI